MEKNIKHKAVLMVDHMPSKEEVKLMIDSNKIKHGDVIVVENNIDDIKIKKENIFRQYYNDRDFFGINVGKVMAHVLEENKIDSYEKLQKEYDIIKSFKKGVSDISRFSKSTRDTIVRVYEILEFEYNLK